MVLRESAINRIKGDNPSLNPSMRVKNITEKMKLLEMCGLHIRLCLITFRTIASKQLK